LSHGTEDEQNLNIKECVKNSIYITSEYYKNNTVPFFSNMTDNVVWYGPAIGQNIVGLDNMVKAWESENNILKFSIGDIEAQYVQTVPSACEIMLMFNVTTFYPNGDCIPIYQRIHFSWADYSITGEDGHRKRTSKIYMIHISNPTKQHKSDFIYPVHYNEICQNQKVTVNEPRISLRGVDNAFYVLSVDSIIWAESEPGQHCLVHLRDKSISVRASISEIEKLTKDSLVRVHSGYIVNPKNLVSMRRFNIVLSDGSVVPVPEKKYTAVKKLLLGK
jgi:hypothetical protein